MRRVAVILAVALGLTPVMASLGGEHSAAKPQTFDGKVLPLAEILKKSGVKLDQDAAPHWYALVTTENKVYPLVKDDGSRMFFKDTRLLNRPMHLTGHLLPGSNLLQVVKVQSVLNGGLHDVDYWCDICSISTYELDKCACCGGPIVLRELPVK